MPGVEGGDEEPKLSPPLRMIFEQAKAFAFREDWTRAGQTILRLRDLAPGSVPVLLLASQVMLQQGRYHEAHVLVLQAVSHPLDAADLLPTARLLRRFEQSELLERVFITGDWRKLLSPAELTELAQLLGFSGLYGLAFECLSQAVNIQPGHADAHYLRGMFEMFSGDMEASDKSLRRALEIDPRMANVHWLLSMRDDAQTAGSHIAEMQRAMVAAKPGSEAQVCFDYSLHYSFHAVGRHEDAWRALGRGHATMRQRVRYDRDEQEDLTAALEDMVLPPIIAPPEPPSRTGLIFIVGMFRSGTTLIERVLAGHTDVVDGGETALLSACMRDATDHDSDRLIDSTIVARAPMADFGSVRRRMLEYAHWRGRGRRWLTEKLPSNFLNVGFILQALPEARILHMRRDPLDTCFSNLRTMFQGSVPYAASQEDLAHYYLQYLRVMAHWHARAPGRILDVDYSAFVDDPETQAQRIMAYCGLSYTPEALDLGRQGGIAATASAAQVRKGILKNRGNTWKPYAQWLQPLRNGLRAAYGTPDID